MNRRRLCLAVITSLVVSACAGDDQAAFKDYDDGVFRNPLGETCERPCLFGIVVGATHRGQASELVSEHVFVDGASRSDVTGETRFYGSERSLTLRAGDDGVVDDIWLAIDDHSVAWNDVLETMGEPDSVRFALWNETFGYVTWHYDSIALTSWLEDGEQVRRDGLVEAVEITAGPVPAAYYPVALNAIAFVHYDTPDFLGFVDTNRYLSHPDCRIAGGPFPAGEPCASFERPW